MIRSILVERQTTSPDFEASGEPITRNGSDQQTAVRALSHLKLLVEAEYRVTMHAETKVVITWNPEDKVHFEITFSGSAEDMIELYTFAAKHKANELAKYTNLGKERL